MTIAILPARLANQIAAGEVVERPASVVKELVENSLDAGATKITIEVEKGGTKLIKISDNGSGIAKDELTLALSRHATSKIKDLDDLESISSLGFRGEALASISSVARLTLTSKPADQENAWQAYAQGRDMEVIVKPAAHPNGTSIDVEDLFFNTPARRKFLRTEKTEFGHIDELIKRIALARFDVAFVLTHNGKVVRNFRPAKVESQYSKRVAAICGSQFLNHAIAVDCQHDNMRLWGWVGRPEEARSQNDLCYSYVNGRMMRDKLINHAIRQAYGERIESHQYPPFVLFFTLDFQDVDVNVHPAKHEVRFHQSRYVHDFICSVVADGLASHCQPVLEPFLDGASEDNLSQSDGNPEVREYVAPLRFDTQHSAGQYQPTSHSGNSFEGSSVGASSFSGRYPEHAARAKSIDSASQIASMQALYSPTQDESVLESVQIPSQLTDEMGAHALQPVLMASETVLVFAYQNTLHALKLEELEINFKHQELMARWHSGLVAQPLLLPVKLKLESAQLALVKDHLALLEMSGVKLNITNNTVQIRQFPAQLRESNIQECFLSLLAELASMSQVEDSHWCRVLATQMVKGKYDFIQAGDLLSQAKAVFQNEFEAKLLSMATPVDLSPYID